MNDLRHHPLDVPVALCCVQLPMLGRSLPEPGVGCENTPTTLSLGSNHPSHLQQFPTVEAPENWYARCAVGKCGALTSGCCTACLKTLIDVLKSVQIALSRPCPDHDNSMAGVISEVGPRIAQYNDVKIHQ